MVTEKRVRSARYAGAVLVNLFALVLAALLDPHSQIGTYVCLVAAVMVTAWVGGRLAGLFAVALATWVGNYPLLTGKTPEVDFGESFLRFGGLVLASLLVSGVTSLRARQWEADRQVQQLDRRLRWLDAMLASHPTPLLLLRPAGEIFYANRAAQCFAGGRSPFGALPGFPKPAGADESPRLGVEWFGRALGGEAIDRETVEWEAEGRSRYLSLSASRMEPMFGESEVLVVSYQDVTELQGLANQRAELVSSVSHSLRAPLTAALLNLEVLLDGTAGKLGAEQARYLQVTYGQLEDLSRLVSDLLTLSKLDHGGIQVRAVLVDLVALVGEVVDSARSRARRRGIDIEFHCELRRLDVRSDPMHLSLVLTELLENAIKYSPRNGCVRVVLTPLDEEIRIEVCDEGPGLLSMEAEAIFGAFYRGAAAMDCPEPGSGLGLGIARKTMRLLGGELLFAPTSGPGAVAKATLPRGPASKADPGSTADARRE